MQQYIGFEPRVDMEGTEDRHLEHHRTRRGSRHQHEPANLDLPCRRRRGRGARAGGGSRSRSRDQRLSLGQKGGSGRTWWRAEAEARVSFCKETIVAQEGGLTWLRGSWRRSGWR